MNKVLIAIISSVVLCGVSAAVLGGMYFGYNREEIGARNACQAQLGNIENVLDNMWKNFHEIGGIANQERETAKNLFREYAEARTSDDQGKMMAWITEQNPNVSPNLYMDLQARLTAGRQEYRQSQTYMLELIRAHTNIIKDPFKSIFVKNSTPFVFKIISSDDTKEAVISGTDNRVFDFRDK